MFTHHQPKIFSTIVSVIAAHQECSMFNGPRKSDFQLADDGFC